VIDSDAQLLSLPLADGLRNLIEQHGIELVLKAADHFRAHAGIPPAPTDHMSMLGLGNDCIDIARFLADRQNSSECVLKGNTIAKIVSTCLSVGNLLQVQYKPKTPIQSVFTDADGVAHEVIRGA
jgi:hypothetical protein